jgi:acid phosphatase family membrane protein YuiD
MTKKDYELMAAVMKSHSVLHQKATKAIMNSLIEHLKKDNPKFDASRFKEASGYIDN